VLPGLSAKKAARYLRQTGIADVSYWGPEMEFFLFNDIRFDQAENCGFYFVDSVEGEWNSGREENPNLGYKPRYKEGYIPVQPHDSLQDVRSEMVLTLIRTGIPAEVHHHEVATAGQGENVARKHNLVVTFMPKPLFGDNGSGMHTSQSLWKGGRNIFHDPGGYALLSDAARWYIGGLLAHAPTTNSYKRLVPGYEAPVNLVYPQRNRSAAVREPVYTDNPRTRRVEFRPPDCSCNTYLAFAAMLMAGIDGIQNRIEPGDPLDENIYELDEREAMRVATVPGALEESLAALEKDMAFLLKGGVFTEDVIEVWMEYKREREIEPMRLRPHPYEFHLYFDI